MDNEPSNIKIHQNTARAGLNMDSSINQLQPGVLTYALNAAMENYDANSFSYQNEEGNELCLTFPSGLVLIGTQFISEKNKHIFFLTNPDTGESEIGHLDNNDCIYHTLVNAPCLNFDINHPILKVAHKVNTCATEIYWTDGLNPLRFLNIDDVPNTLKPGSTLCDPLFTDQIDCNQLSIQPKFNTPLLSVIDVVNGGNLLAGTYQFAIQYSDALGNPYNSYQSITNPTPIADIHVTTLNFNYPVDKSIIIQVSDLDITGQFQYFNIAVIKTINAISTVELVGTFYITNSTIKITYTGQNVTSIPLSIQDIFEKFPFYDTAQDVTATQEILVFSNLSMLDRLNYQGIASQIHLQWETWRIPAIENYADELNATNLRSQLRDEVYPYEIAFLLANGKQTDSFHIPGRTKSNSESIPDIPNTNPDFIGNPDYVSGGVGYSPYWKIYNTASVTGNSPGYSADINYRGPYQIGEMAYWESTEEYPCNTNVWGDLGGQKIRHHKFPDVLVSPIFESKIFIDSTHLVMGNDAVFPIGIHVDTQQILGLIGSSNLTHSQKVEIIGYKILRGDRSTNKSIVAKGILRNAGKYTKDNQDYYYPNYPYNDLGVDPFLDITNNAFAESCTSFDIDITALGPDGFTQLSYTSCITGKSISSDKYTTLGTQQSICSLTKPTSTIGQSRISYSNYDTYLVQSSSGSFDFCSGWRVQWLDRIEGLSSTWLRGFPDNDVLLVNVIPGTKPGCIEGCDHCGIFITFQESVVNNTTCTTDDTTNSLPPLFDNGRLIFNSPETSFGQPFLGNILKLENVIYGKGLAHFIQVRNNAKYKLLTEEAQRQALTASEKVAGADTTLLIASYQAYIQIYLNGMTRQNYAYSFNSIADYNYADYVPNNTGVKQRNLDISRYLIPIVESVGDDHSVNNYQRESSIFLKTNGTNLPFPNDQISINNKISDHSRFTISGKGNCENPSNIEDITVVSYYASLKNDIVNQWGQMYSYETIDTGFERVFEVPSTNNTVFGGDTFISRFGFKTKLPFFLDNRVNAPDDSDVFYDQIGNVAFPKYWHSARSITKDYVTSSAGILPGIISYKAHNFDCPTGNTTASINTSTSTTSTTLAPGSTVVSNTLLFYSGYFYLFAYGVPYFYCESSYNTDLRQAFNNREGDFYPHVTTSIPDDWVQESWVPIAQDNTYYYNTTYSKQNTENTFTHIPIDWDRSCFTQFPFRAIYSDVQTSAADNRVNAWLTFRALSYFDFPQNYGPLISLDGIQNRAVLARFEDKSLLYNNLLTINTSNPQAAFVGNDSLFKGAPPIDFAETDLGYVGSQNKFLLRIPQGQITVDAKRGQIFLISDTQAIDLSAFGSGMNRFFTDHLAFEILRYFPDVNTDNHFAGIGLHGVYDSKYDRVIITKLDYIPHPEFTNQIKFDNVTNQFYIEEEIPTTTSTTTTTTSTIFVLECCYEYYYNGYSQIGINGASLANTGWRVATRGDWTQLYSGSQTPLVSTYINMGQYKSIDDLCINWLSPNDNALDSFGLHLLPVGYRNAFDGTFFGINQYTAYSYGNGITDEIDFSYNDPNAISATNGTMNWGNPVRLVSDAVGILDGTTITYIGNNGKLYNAVCINELYWITENLKETLYRNLTPITNANSNATWIAATNGAYSIYNDSETPCYPATSTTTTTTTTTIIVSEGSVLFNTSDNPTQVYAYDPVTNISSLLTIPGILTTSSDIAHTANKLWLYSSHGIDEWNITLSPFTAIFNRSITNVNGSAGLCAKDDVTLINNAGGDVYECDITTTTSVNTLKFSSISGRTVTGDFVLTTTNKLIVLNNNSGGNKFVTQYDYTTGAVDLDIPITLVAPFGLYEYSGGIYIADSATLYNIDITTPYTLTYLSSLSYGINGASQLPSFSTINFIP